MKKFLSALAILSVVASYTETIQISHPLDQEVSYSCNNRNTPTPKEEICYFINHPWHVQVGANYTRVKLMPHDNLSYTGNLGGIQALIEYRTRDHVYAALKLAWQEGPTYGSSGKLFLLDCDVQERIGYTFDLRRQQLMLSVYTGFGFRYLGHYIRPPVATLKLLYQEFYVPVGFLIDYPVNSIFNLGFNGTWMPQAYPSVVIIPLDGARWILKNTWNNFILELPLTFTIRQSDQVVVILKPFFSFWRDGPSTAKMHSGVTLGLPGNIYHFWGIDLNLSYSF